MRFEDAMYEAMKSFHRKSDFKEFATSSDGLHLESASVHHNAEDHESCFRLFMRAVMLLWKQTSGNKEDHKLSDELLNRAKLWRKNHKEIGVLDVKRLLFKVNEETIKDTSQHVFVELGHSDFNIFPDTVAVNFYNTPVQRQEYSPQVSFKQQASKMPGRSIKMSEFFNGVRYVALVGGVGYGKTEMLKRISIDVVRNKLRELKDVKYVRFISLLGFDGEKTVTAAELLFEHIPGFHADVKTCAVRHIFQHPQEFLLVLDGIDQLPFELSNHASIRDYKSEAKTSKILSSLCSGHLLPDMRVLVSSREHAIRHFTHTMRPDKVIALSGLSLKSIEKLVHKFGGAKREEIWAHLDKRSPSLLSLSSIPMFLMFTITVLGNDGNNPPETSTEMFMHVLNHHVTSEHVSDNIIPIISKLKPMSYHGMETGKITFELEDLKNASLSIDEARDLLIALPGVRARNQKLFDGHFRLNFCHQSIQEALVALYVVEMPLEEFRTFVKHKIHLPKWVIVRRMVCGLLFHPTTREAAKGNDPSVGLLNLDSQLKEKQDILMTSLASQLDELQGDGMKRTELLELMHSLHEAGEAMRRVIEASMEEINLLNLPVTKNDIHVLLSAISFSKNLTFLSLASCKFDAQDILDLAYTFRDHDVTVQIMLLGGYEKELSKDETEAVTELQKYVEDSLWLAYKINADDRSKIREVMKLVERPDKVYSWMTENGTLVILDKDD